MREIKFRAWDKEFNRMIFQHDMNGTLENKEYLFSLSKDNVELLYYDKDYSAYVKHQAEIMQYTGVKDKNGKEIYERDVVKVCNPFSDDVLLIGEVKNGEFEDSNCDEYSCTRYGYYVDVKWKEYQSNAGYPIQDGSKIEVVENIYENKDLLEK